MQRWALPLLLLAGITGVLLLIFAGQPHAGRSDPGSADAGQSPLVTGDPLPGSGAAPGSGTQEPGSIQRTNTDPTLPPSAPGNTDLIEIQVLRRADGAPVPEAEVLVLDLSEKQEKEAAEAFFVGVTVDGFLEKFGQKHQADASGIARIPKPSGDSVLMARKGPLFGLIQWSKLELRRVPGQPVRIEVEESSDLRIRVKDESGRPVAGVMVALRVGAGDFFSFDLLRARTGEDGIGLIRRAEAFAEIFSPKEGSAYSAAIAAVLPAAVAVTLDLDRMPTEPVELTLPACGSVLVKIRNADGSPVRDSVLVALAKARDNPEDDDDWLAPGMPGFDAVSRRTEEGELLFEHVGLGISLQASAVFPGAPQASNARKPGPQRAGETVEMVIVEQRNYPIVLTQVQGVDGRPLANQAIKVRFLMSDDQVDWRNEKQVRTDGDGRIRIALLPVAEEEQALAIAWARPGLNGLPELLARTELERPLRVGENDLGIVKLLAAPVLASGRVLDSEGRPISGATVVPQRRLGSAFDPQLQEVESDYERSRLTDLSGAFTLTGAWEEPQLGLEVYAEGFFNTNLVVTPGATDLVIKLATSFGITGRLIADPGVDVSLLVLDLEYLAAPNGPDGSEVVPGIGVDAETGRFTLDGAQPGQADLVIRAPSLRAEEGEILRIPGVQIGAALQDERLNPIDLRGRLFGCTLLVRSADSKPLQELQAWPAANPSAVAYGWGGNVGLLSSEPIGEVVVFAFGCREARLTPLHPRENVVLQPGLPVRISVPGNAAGAGNFRLGVFLIPDEAGGSWTRGARGVFAANGTAEIALSQPGRYRAEFIVAPAGAEVSPSWWEFFWVERGADEAPQSLDVQEAAGVQEFRLRAPPAERIAEAASKVEPPQD